VNGIFAAFEWIANSAHWVGTAGIPNRIGEHLGYSVVTTVIAVLVAMPVGVALGHARRGTFGIVSVAGAMRALPTLGLVTLLALVLGIGIVAPLIAITVLAIPPILAGAYSGIASADSRAVEAARAIGMTEWQVLARVEVPLGLPLIIGGVRAAALQVIATWTVAAILPVGGLGRYIFDGLPVQNYPEMLGGSILVIVLALVVDGVLVLVQKSILPRGVAVVHSSASRKEAPHHRVPAS
jgi:osmoprotectant transport system permease protein